MTPDDLAQGLAGGGESPLPEPALAEWMTAQRWFSSKQRDVHEFNVLDTVVLQESAPVVAIVIAEARFDAGTHQLYQVPIAVRPLSDRWDEGVIFAADDHVTYDALLDPAAAAVLAGRFAARAAIERRGGCLRFQWDDAVEPA